MHAFLPRLPVVDSFGLIVTVVLLGAASAVGLYSARKVGPAEVVSVAGLAVLLAEGVVLAG